MNGLALTHTHTLSLSLSLWTLQMFLLCVDFYMMLLVLFCFMYGDNPQIRYYQFLLSETRNPQITV
jgi:hypothetical protein